MAEHNEIGKIGEKLAESFLMKQGYLIMDKNYRVLQGEIDIIAKKDTIIHFVEVKSIKVRNVNNTHSLTVRPEDNLTRHKWQRIITTIGFYLAHKGISSSVRHQVDLACVYIDTETRQGRVKLLENVIVE